MILLKVVSAIALIVSAGGTIGWGVAMSGQSVLGSGCLLGVGACCVLAALAFVLDLYNELQHAFQRRAVLRELELAYTLSCDS